MEEYVLLSDIHGNAMALEEVVEREGVGANYLVLGDLMGLNAQPAEVLHLLNEINPRVMLLGNHDRAIFHEDEGHVNDRVLSEFEHDHTLSNLTPVQQNWLHGKSFMEVIEGSPRIATTHAMPWPDQASGYERGNTGIGKGSVTHIASVVSDDYDYVFHGHTHEQYSLDAAKFGHDVHFVNPGTLGYDGNYAAVNVESGDVDLRSVEWDHDALKDHIQSVLPDNAPHVEEWL